MIVIVRRDRISGQGNRRRFTIGQRKDGAAIGATVGIKLAIRAHTINTRRLSQSEIAFQYEGRCIFALGRDMQVVTDALEGGIGRGNVTRGIALEQVFDIRLGLDPGRLRAPQGHRIVRAATVAIAAFAY
ncbi:hypothetical protein [Variovorax sp. GT1P44]|uniref:hypothetical protein n=1 Tax=Variovorax sp. GT1P44 TaxID=3443742 RepID=UPI003F473439